jgi:hypothetical protein
MSLLIYSGLLYLIGISIILILKPSLMFTKEGVWKEFGLGRNKEKYTWLPFWLFAVIWAILSYLIVLTIAGATGIGGVKNKTELSVPTESIEPENVSMKSLSPAPQSITPNKKRSSAPSDMKPGYYILDTNETMKRGIPKYIYLGPEAPNLVYHNHTTESLGAED